MTSERSETASTDRSPLRRRANGKVIGGVAGGLGDYLNVDPLLVRIGFVALMVFGGAGLVLYVLTWILLPAEGDDHSIVERLLLRFGLTPRRIGIVVIVLAGAVLFALLLPIESGGMWIDPTAIWATAVIIVGIVLLRRYEPQTRPASEVAVIPARPLADAVPALPALPARLRSPLGWYAIAAVLSTIGLLAVVDNVADVEVELGQFFGASVAVLGIGLVVGAWWGRARLLIVLGLVVLPLALVASFVTAPLEGGIGDQRFAPVNPAELRHEYRLVGGRVTLDLRELAATEPIRISASVALGQVVVILPPDANLEIDARAGAGGLLILDSRQVGTTLADRSVRAQADGPTFILDLETGIGEVLVERLAGG